MNACSMSDTRPALKVKGWGRETVSDPFLTSGPTV